MKYVLLALLTIALAGCGSNPTTPDLRPPVVQTKYVTVDCGVPPGVDKVQMRPVAIRVVQLSDGSTVFVLTADSYENLGKNVSDILAAFKQLAVREEFWEQCIKKAQEEAAKLSASP